MKASGAQIAIKCLKEQGVDLVFGYPGGSVLDLYDALYRDGSIRHILTAHEQGAAHAADGYARATGRTGVVIATSGPGATNLVTGIATAFMDSVPLVAITGNVGLSFLGRDSFQEIDITGITMPVTKHNFIVKRACDIAPVLREAFAIAQTGRKGPVLVDILKNAQTERCDYVPVRPVRTVPRPLPPEELEGASEAIGSSARPLLLTGGGAISSGASAQIKALAEKLNAPVVSTLMGLGAFPASHPLFMGMVGMHGTATAAALLRECDCLIAVGARFSDRVALDRATFAKDKKVVHIEIDDAEIGKNVPATHPVLGDAKEALTTLLPLLRPSDGKFAARASELRREELARAPRPALGREIVIEAAKRAKDAVVVTDVGQHQMWTAQSYPIEAPRTLITSGGLGTMGFGMGAAIGAALGTGKRVVLVTGDGSFNMNLNELSTAVSLGIPLTILLMNNRALGMVRQWQKVFYGGRYSQTALHKQTDYVKFAESFGAKGLRIGRREEIAPVLGEALACPTPVLVDCRISEDETVLPMIKPGASYDEIITQWEEKQ